MGQLLALFDILTVSLLIAGCLLIWGGLRPQNAILLQEPATPTIQVISLRGGHIDATPAIGSGIRPRFGGEGAY